MHSSIEYGSFKSYVIGLILSIALTFAAYFLFAERLLEGWALDFSIGALAIIQAVAQLILFLSLFREPKPRWNLIIFLFMVLVLLIVVIGTLWIMANLRYNLAAA